MKSFIKGFILVLRVFQNICNMLGIAIILLLLSLLILGICDYVVWLHLHISSMKQVTGLQVIYLFLCGLLVLIVNAFAVTWIVKSFVKSYIKSAQELKRDCWDEFTGMPANIVARIINKGREIQ